MRIVGGRLRGLKLAGFDVKAIRPTTDRVREALFNILAHDTDLRTDAGPFPAGVQVLDVFAGTGALGLEALSRGASSVAFIERDGAALSLLRENIKRARVTGAVHVSRADALQPREAPQPARLVLMDPPYGSDMAGSAIAALDAAGWVTSETLIVAETDTRDALGLQEAYRVDDERNYGRTRLTFLRKQ